MGKRRCGALLAAAVMLCRCGGEADEGAALKGAGGDPRYTKKSWSETCAEIREGTNPGGIDPGVYARYQLTLRWIGARAVGLVAVDPGRPGCQELEDYYRGRNLNLARTATDLELSFVIKLHDLVGLNLSGNDLKTIEGLTLIVANSQIEHGGLDDSLVDLDLSNNRLTSVAPLGQYHALRRLRLSHNALPSLEDVANPADFADPFLPPNWPQVEALDLADNPDFKVPPATPGAAVPRTFSILRFAWRTLDLSRTGLTHVQFLRGAVRSSLMSLDLDGLKLDGQAPPSTLPFNQLLRLSAKGTAGFPLALFHVPYVDAVGAKSSQVPALVFLDLSEAQVDVPQSLSLLPKVYALVLAGNRLLTTLADLAALPQLKLFSGFHSGLMGPQALPEAEIVDIQGTGAQLTTSPRLVLADNCEGESGPCRTVQEPGVDRAAILADAALCLEFDGAGRCVKSFGECPGEIKTFPEDPTLPIKEICCYGGPIQMPFGEVRGESEGKVCAKLSIADAVFP